MRHQEFELFGPDPMEESYSVGMMIGKGFRRKHIQIQFSGGLEIIGGIKRGKSLSENPSSGWFSLDDPRHYEREKFISPSIPLEINLMIIPTKYFGPGISIFGDLNLKRPMYG